MALNCICRSVQLKFLSVSANVHLRLGTRCASSSFRILLNMKTAYFQNEKDDEKLHIQLLFDNESPRIQKTISFERKMSESVDKFLHRLNGRIEEAWTRKLNGRKKKNNQDQNKPEITGIQVDSHFLLNDERIPNATLFTDFLHERNCENLKLRILETDYKIVLNNPTIVELILPNKILVGCPVAPKKLITRCTQDRCEFTWFIKNDKKKEWNECGTSYSYMPKKEDVNSFLKVICVPRNGEKKGVKYEAIIGSPVQEFTDAKFILERQKFTSNKTASNEIRVVTYNILADVYTGTKEAKTVLFKYCNPDIIDFNYRVGLILLELEGYNADIICLQEVDRKFFNYHLNSYLTSKEFRGFFSEKEKAREGCALYFNTKKFDILEECQYYLSEQLMDNPLLADIKEKIIGNTKLLDRISGISTLIQIAILKCQNEFLVVGNSHLYFHPDADHIRLLQGIIAFRLLLQKINEVKDKNPGKNVSLIWCGDFNSTPDCGIYKLMTQGAVDNNEIDWKSCPDEVITGISFSNSLKMSSACGILPYTNYTESFKECLDYIYYQTDRLELKSFVPLPSEEVLRKETAIPSSHFPSDHIALIADFKWKL